MHSCMCEMWFSLSLSLSLSLIIAHPERLHPKQCSCHTFLCAWHMTHYLLISFATHSCMCVAVCCKGYQHVWLCVAKNISTYVLISFATHNILCNTLMYVCCCVLQRILARAVIHVWDLPSSCALSDFTPTLCVLCVHHTNMLVCSHSERLHTSGVLHHTSITLVWWIRVCDTTLWCERHVSLGAELFSNMGVYICICMYVWYM